MEKNGIHIIDLHKTEVKLNEAASAMKQQAKRSKQKPAAKAPASDVEYERYTNEDGIVAFRPKDPTP